MVREVGLEKTGSVAPCSPVLVRPAGKRGGMGDGNDEHLYADQKVLDALFNVVRCPISYLMNQLQFRQAGDYDALRRERQT